MPSIPPLTKTWCSSGEDAYRTLAGCAVSEHDVEAPQAWQGSDVLVAARVARHGHFLDLLHRWAPSIRVLRRTPRVHQSGHFTDLEPFTLVVIAIAIKPPKQQ